MQDGSTRMLDVYVPDAAGGYLSFDDGLGASATSSTFFTLPQNGVLVDASFAAAPTATRFRFVSNGIPSPHVLRFGSHAYNLNNRPTLNIPIGAGNRISAVNVA